MSDYISLEELRAMTDLQLYSAWCEAQFPFDNASCGSCITNHKFQHNAMCSHEDFRSQAKNLSLRRSSFTEDVRSNLAEIYALRMFHRDLYPSTPEPPVAAEEPRVLAAK